jgi:hypothetical protein
MSKFLSGVFGAGISIGLSKTAIAVLRTGGWRGATAILADRPLTEGGALAPQCATLLADADCAGLPLTVTVSDQWARLFMVTPPHNSGRLQDFQGAAAMRFQSLYGEGIDDWQLVADWHTRKPFLACALPHSLLETLRQAALHSKLHLMSVKPQFALVWNKWNHKLGAGAWFGVVQENSLTLGAIAPASQRLCAVRTIAIPSGGDDPRWLREQVERVALRLDLPTPTQLQLAGNLRQYWIAGETSAADGTLTVSNIEKIDKAADCAAAPRQSLSGAVLLARSRMHG